MLFKDILDRKAAEVRPDFIALLEKIVRNQTHVADLLLVRENGFYNKDVFTWDNVEPQSPYMIGPNLDGLSESTHYRFIDNYRRGALLKETYPEYVRQFEYSEERSKEIADLTEIEEMSIQLEMLIYLKIWESDSFIRKIYQLARLVHKENYDWHFVIKELKNGQEKHLTGTRDEIIRVKFRDRMQSEFPAIYHLTKRAFKTQVRNAIAHSQYSMMSRYIQLNNFHQDDPYSQMKSLSFEEWTEMFHDTLMLYNEMIGVTKRIDAFYAELIKQSNDEIEIRMSDQENKNVRFSVLKYDRVWKRYYWKSNEQLAS